MKSKVKIMSFGVVPVKFEKNEPVFLLLRNKWYWEPPKGKGEQGETAIEAAIRETKEEADIDEKNLNFKWGYDYFDTDRYMKGKKMVRFFVAECLQDTITLPFNDELGKPEHDGYAWVNYEHAKNLVNERIGKVIDWAYNVVKV